MVRLDLEGMEQRTKWLLLIVSVATLVLLIVSALQENVFDEWRRIRRDYTKILEAKATDDRGRAIAAQFEVGIDQIVLPALGSVDRCITCHTGLDDPRMVDEAQPFTTHPTDYLADYGHPNPVWTKRPNLPRTIPPCQLFLFRLWLVEKHFRD